MDPQHIIDVCEANWDANKDDCNHFVKAVANSLGITLFNSGDDADKILARLSNSAAWSVIPHDTNLSDIEADASAGQFIIAGLRKADFTPPRQHGHVVVVVMGDDAAHPGYPLAYWGQLGGTGQKDSSIRNTFTPSADLPNVQYFATSLPNLEILRDQVTSIKAEGLVDAKSTIEDVIKTIVDSMNGTPASETPHRMFPNGIDVIEIDVKAGPLVVSVKIAGPKTGASRID